MSNRITIVISIVFIALLVGCGSQGTILTDTDRKAILAFTEAKTDNLLAGMNESNYAMFSMDFDSAMLSGITQAGFVDMKKDRDAKLGLYVSRQVNSVIKQGAYYVVIYDAIFEKDDAVAVRIFFNIKEPHEISGLWFNK